LPDGRSEFEVRRLGKRLPQPKRPWRRSSPFFGSTPNSQLPTPNSQLPSANHPVSPGYRVRCQKLTECLTCSDTQCHFRRALAHTARHRGLVLGKANGFPCPKMGPNRGKTPPSRHGRRKWQAACSLWREKCTSASNCRVRPNPATSREGLSANRLAAATHPTTRKDKTPCS